MGAMTQRRKIDNVLVEKMEAARAETRRLKLAIREHHKSVGKDDWDADARLWAVLSLPSHPR